MPTNNPPHPGGFIRTEIRQPAGAVGHGRRGCASGIAAGPVQPFERQRRSIRRQSATHRKAFGVKMDTLMRMQASYEIAQIRKREKKIRARRFHVDVHPKAGHPLHRT